MSGVFPDPIKNLPEADIPFLMSQIVNCVDNEEVLLISFSI